MYNVIVKRYQVISVICFAIRMSHFAQSIIKNITL